MLRLPPTRVALSALVILGSSTCAAHANPSSGASSLPLVATTTAQDGPPIDVHIAPDSPLGRARAAMALGDYAAARSLAEAGIEGNEPLAAAELHWVAARAAERLRDIDATLAHFDAVAATAGSPLSRWATLAHAELLRYRDPEAAAAKAQALPESFAGAARAARIHRPRAAESAPPHEDAAALAEAHSLLQSLRYEAAARAFHAIAASTSDAAVRCEARLQEGTALERARERRRAAPILAAVAADCADADTRATAFYRAGRAYQAAGDRSAALEQFLALPRELPEHRLADDGYVLAARLVERDDPEEAERLLRHLAYDHGQGDMVPDALFRLFWAARGQGEHAVALLHVEAIDAAAEARAEPELRGRASYWRARTLVALERPDEAEAAYEATARSYPLSYYAQQAIRRLAELDSPRATALLAAMSETAPVAPPSLPEGGAARRARALLRVGEPKSAELELRSADLLGERATEASLVAVAALYHEAGATPLAIELVREHGAVFRSALPVGEGRARFRVAYPLAYSPLIETIAEAVGVPAAFLRAVAREESSFSPTVVSHARAYGLIQILLPTAAHFADSVGVEPTAALLREPSTNLRFGAAFIQKLLERYGGAAAFIPPAYNAGPGALDRWLEGKSGRPFDELVEEIPYDETRRYTRRVLESYGVYSFLASAELPSVPTTLP